MEEGRKVNVKDEIFKWQSSVSTIRMGLMEVGTVVNINTESTINANFILQ